MKEGNAIEVRNVEKEFRVHLESSNQLKDAVIFGNRNKVQIRNVLRGVSFEIPKGQAVALIGKNGCGKSTSLKLLTKILKPNKGEVELKGRVSSLIELGAGFHPDMTGRENIYINASIFGIKHKEVDKRIDSIIRFSELEDVIDTPVRTYSSGMYMRLAFSVAINVNADILLIDEILAVGDSAFQEKCFNKLLELKRSGLTIVIVSHSLGQVKRICDRCIWIKDGLIQMDDDVNKVCDEYEYAMDEGRRERARLEAEQILKEQEERKKLEEEKRRAEEERKKEELKRKEAEELERKKEKERLALEEEKRRKQEELNATCWQVSPQCCADAHREGNFKAKFTEIKMLDVNGNLCTEFNVGDTINIEAFFCNMDINSELKFVLCITRKDGLFCFGTSSSALKKQFIKTKKQAKICFNLSNFLLNDGKYFIDIYIEDSNKNKLDCCYSIIEFKMNSVEKNTVGIFNSPCEFLYL